MTPVLDADGKARAIVQGPVAVARFSAKGNSETVAESVLTAARMLNGTIIDLFLDVRPAIFALVGQPLRPGVIRTVRYRVTAHEPRFKRWVTLLDFLLAP